MAGGGSVSVFVTTNRLPNVRRNIGPETERALDELLDEVVLFAKAFAAVDTGEMRSKIAKTKSAVVARAPHSKFVEHGTRYMMPQKFMQPALARAAPDLPRYFGGFGVRLLA